MMSLTIAALWDRPVVAAARHLAVVLQTIAERHLIDWTIRVNVSHVRRLSLPSQLRLHTGTLQVR